MTSSIAPEQMGTVALCASVVIPTYNRRAILERVLGGLSRQTVPSGTFEVMVVADGCTDDTVTMCRELEGKMPFQLYLIEQANAGPAAARNRGVQESHARLVIFLDDDVVPDEGMVAAHLASHAPDGEDSLVAIGPMLPPRDKRLNAWCAWEERNLCAGYAAMEAGNVETTYRRLFTGNVSVMRDHIIQVGGFDPAMFRNEDIELGRRLHAHGCTFAFLPNARGWHYVNRSFASWLNIQETSALGELAIGRIHGSAEVMGDIAEYHARHPLVRLCVRVCAGSPVLVALVTQVLRICAVAGWALHVPLLSDACCSLIYNLRFFDTLGAGLGGRRQFFRMVRMSRTGQKVGDLQMVVPPLSEDTPK